MWQPSLISTFCLRPTFSISPYSCNNILLDHGNIVFTFEILFYSGLQQEIRALPVCVVAILNIPTVTSAEFEKKTFHCSSIYCFCCITTVYVVKSEFVNFPSSIRSKFYIFQVPFIPSQLLRERSARMRKSHRKMQGFFHYSSIELPCYQQVVRSGT